MTVEEAVTSCKSKFRQAYGLAEKRRHGSFTFWQMRRDLIALPDELSTKTAHR